MQINTLSAESVVCRSSRVSVRRTASKKERKDWTGLEDMTQKGKGKTRQQVERTLSFRRGEENNKAFAEIVVLPSPTADFTSYNIELDQKPSGTIQFTNTSLLADNYIWDFGDGEIVTSKSTTKSCH